MARPNHSGYQGSVLGIGDVPCTEYIIFIILLPFSTCTYYLPISALQLPLPLQKTSKSTFCEYKGWATYYSINAPSSSATSSEKVKDRIWSYEKPTKDYEAIKSYVSFYAGPWDCYVDGELVKPQPGDFYGGWTTSELEGIIKGDAATRWM
ncbi:hypothetical protein PVAG01_09082 [Phlyctema vagabunda]|uniref:DUF427 domain-containing protein n=1 Tax=Phlyctema vagabunda TaxID=108571 RepID=A0ABR4P6C7_9HELO